MNGRQYHEDLLCFQLLHHHPNQGICRIPFQSCGLSNFAEQTGEAIHEKFKPTWARFKILEEHPDHADRLLKAVMDFDGRKIS